MRDDLHPFKEPKYRIWQRNLMWGCDWTKLLINHVRWYLIILIDFFSRYIIGYDIHPSINAAHVKHLYAMGLKSQGIAPKDVLPELRILGNQRVLLPHGGRYQFCPGTKTH